MYTVKADGTVLYDPRIEDTAIFNPRITLEDNLASSFSFAMYPNHPSYGSLRRLKTTIEVYDDERPLFRGRVLNDEQGWDNALQVICEGELAYFNDTIVRPYDWTGGVRDYVAMLVDSHNGQVGADRQFMLRNVTVSDPNDNIVRASSDYPSTWGEIGEKLLGLLGGHMALERADGVTYLDYLADSPHQTAQKIELGKNLLNFKRTVSGADIATAIIPLGAVLDDENEETTDYRLTIADVTEDGKDYVYDQDAVDAYGWIFRTVVYDDITVAENLLQRGLAVLGEVIEAQASVEINAIDLSLIDKTIDNFRLLEYVEAISEPHGLHDLFLVTKMDIDLVEPANNKLTLGRDYGALTGQTSSNSTRISRIESSQAGTQYDMRTILANINFNAGRVVIGNAAEGLSLQIASDGIAVFKLGVEVAEIRADAAGTGITLQTGPLGEVTIAEDGSIHTTGSITADGGVR